MIVFEFMCDIMNELGPRMDRWAKEELKHIDGEEDDQVL